MSKRYDTLWTASAHTKAKIAMLRYYLDAWFPILAQGVPLPILYVDGFAGPGYYTNHPEGSPLAALKCIEAAIESLGAKNRCPQITCVFIEEDLKRFEVLQEAIEPFRERRRVGIRAFNKRFVDGVLDLEREVELSFQGDHPNFIFADPFCTGIALHTFKRCMAGKRGELLINLDADGISRIYKADNPRREEQLDEIFGGRCWATELGPQDLPLREQANRILHLYKRRLGEIKGVDYVFQFEMRGKQDTLNYFLVYATKNPVAMMRMKEAMSKVDQNGQYCFSDADEDQTFLISEDHDAHYANKLHVKFVSKGRVPFREVERFALCETLAKSATPLLRILETSELIEVEMKENATRRRGTFEREKTAFVTFHPIPKQGDFFA
jgi:three-Cys-motif partner protein